MTNEIKIKPGDAVWVNTKGLPIHKAFPIFGSNAIDTAQGQMLSENSTVLQGEIKRQEHIWTLSSESMSEPAIKSWMQFLAMASNAHTIDTTLRADSKEYSFQTDFLKYVKWLPVYRNDVTGELEDVADSHLAKTIAHNKKCSIELHDLKCAIREALCQIEGNKCDLSEGAGAHEVLHNAGVQRDLDIIKKCCGVFL